MYMIKDLQHEDVLGKWEWERHQRCNCASRPSEQHQTTPSPLAAHSRRHVTADKQQKHCSPSAINNARVVLRIYNGKMNIQWIISLQLTVPHNISFLNNKQITKHH